MQSKTGPVLIGLAYLALVVFIMLFCADQSADFDDYSKYWGLFGTLVGVATGAIPSFFFKTQADSAKERADREASKAQLFAAVADPADAKTVQETNPELF